MDSRGNAKSDDLHSHGDLSTFAQITPGNVTESDIWDDKEFAFAGAVGEGSKELQAFDAEFGIDHAIHEMKALGSDSNPTSRSSAETAMPFNNPHGYSNKPFSNTRDTVPEGSHHHSEPTEAPSASSLPSPSKQPASSQAPSTISMIDHPSAFTMPHGPLYGQGISRLLSGQSQLNKPLTSSPLARAVTTNADILRSPSRGPGTTVTSQQREVGSQLNSTVRMRRSETSASAPEFSFHGLDHRSQYMLPDVHSSAPPDYTTMMRDSAPIHGHYPSVSRPSDTTSILHSPGVYWQEGTMFDANVTQPSPFTDFQHTGHSAREIYNRAIFQNYLSFNGVDPYQAQQAQIYGQPGQPSSAAPNDFMAALIVKQERQGTHSETSGHDNMGTTSGTSRTSRLHSLGANDEFHALGTSPSTPRGTIGDLDLELSYIEVQLRFVSLEDFDEYVKNCKDVRGFEDDETFPYAPEQQQAYVKDFILAMSDMSRANDKPLMVEMWDKLRKNEHLVEDSAWNLLRLCNDSHQQSRPLGSGHRPPQRPARYRDHVREICKVLRTEKTICKHVVSPAYNPGFVDDPAGAAQRVSNNRKVNESKKVAIEKGRDALSRFSTGQNTDDYGYGIGRQLSLDDTTHDPSLEDQSASAQASNTFSPFSNAPGSIYDTPEIRTQRSKGSTGKGPLAKVVGHETPTPARRGSRKKSKVEDDDDASYQPTPTPPKRKRTRNTKYPARKLSSGKYAIETIPSPPLAQGSFVDNNHSESRPSVSGPDYRTPAFSQNATTSGSEGYRASTMPFAGLTDATSTTYGQYDGSIANPFTFGPPVPAPVSSYLRQHNEGEGQNHFVRDFQTYHQFMPQTDTSAGPSYLPVVTSPLDSISANLNHINVLRHVSEPQHVNEWQDFPHGLGGVADPFDDTMTAHHESQLGYEPELESEDEPDNETSSEYDPSGH